MAFRVLTKKYEVDKCFLSTLNYMVGDNSKNEIFLIDRDTDLSKHIPQECSKKKFNIFSICVLDKDNGKEGFNCFINLDVLAGAVYSFDYKGFGDNLTHNQKLSILLCARFIDALYRTNSSGGSGLYIKTCMSRVLTLLKYDNNERDNKLILNVVKNKPEQFHSYSTLYDVDYNYIRDIIKRLSSPNKVRLVDDTVKSCIVDGVEISPIIEDNNCFNAIKVVCLKGEIYNFINLSLLDKFVETLSSKCIQELLDITMDVDIKIDSDSKEEEIKAIYRIYMLIYALNMEQENIPSFTQGKYLLEYVKDFIMSEYKSNKDSMLNCIKLKEKIIVR